MPQVHMSENDIAIVGVAIRVPEARNARQYWSNLVRGVEAVRTFTDEELKAAGVPPELLANPHYVKSGVVLENMDHFDPDFFGFSPKEAGIMDPQHRHLLECAWEALEDAGHPPELFRGPIGVFGGCGMGAYFIFNLLTNPDLVDSVGLFLLRHTGNDKDFLVTRISYCLNLRGPSVSIQTACSTSLVAVHYACQSLLSGECDMALAGGVTIEVPHRQGYLYQPGEILSPDGHCRAFDHKSQGTIFGSGAGVVALRRLKDALDDGDSIYAVIKGSAVNNDGSGKVGYLAPSVDGQAAAITEALAVAGVSADSIGYVECHGTGTPMGDPIEVSALTQAFRQNTERVGFCGIGSVKTNIGHLDTAAGVASLVKAALALEHKKLPPSLNFESPNPNIDFAHSPFYVVDQLRDWPADRGPRRAGVNSLGVGGTNAYVVLEEPPSPKPSTPSRRRFQLLTLSARNRAALDATSQRLAEHLTEHPDEPLADVAYTLQVGRRAFSHRRVLACADHAEAACLLQSNDARRVFTHVVGNESPSVVFMFPGGGAQYVRMAAGLYETEPVFREHMDRGFELLRSKVGFDLKTLLYGTDGAATSEQLERPSMQLPAIFLVEYALAQLWRSWGVEPAALIGHSMGENCAACVSGVLRFEDALGLVLLRGQLMDEVPQGGMLSVPLPADELRALLGDTLDLASVNSPELSVASGPITELEKLAKTLAERNVEATWVRINIAAHSRMLDGALERFGAYLRSIPLSPPKIPFISNRTGTWITREQATSPEYWVEHLRNTILFSAGVKTLLETPGRVFLEVGPGKTLSSFTRQQPGLAPGQSVLSSMRHPDEVVADAVFFMTVFGRLWASGVPVDLAKPRAGETRRRVRLPTYPFQGQRYWIEPGKPTHRTEKRRASLAKSEALDDWFFRPVWRRIAPPAAERVDKPVWLVFMDETGLGEQLVARLRQRGHDVVVVRLGDAYYQLSETEYRLSPEHGRENYDALLRDLVATGHAPTHVAHLWLLATGRDFRPGSNFFHRNQERGFYSLLFLAQALGENNLRRPLHITVVSNGMQQVEEEPVPYPEQATVLGPCKVIPREYPEFTCTSVDIRLPFGRDKRLTSLFRHAPQTWEPVLSRLEAELLAAPGNRIVALRPSGRWQQEYEKFDFANADVPQKGHGPHVRIRKHGTYLITGGLGGIGLTLADHLAKSAKANLVLLTRSPLPPREQWESWVARRGADDPTSRRIRSVRALEVHGANVLVLASDVTDAERMQQALDTAAQRFGPIHGVIHAAGVLHDGLVQVKTQADVESVFSPKVYGTLVLDSLLGSKPLDFFVLFSSASTAIAPAGQVDYVASNAFLNAFAQSRAQGHYPTIAINWGVWRDVGMAADAAERIQHGDEHGRNGASAEQLAKHPLFDGVYKDGPERWVLSARYAPRTHWILDQHRTRAGRALIPGTAYLEMARAALAEIGETQPLEIRDLFFFRPLEVGDDETRDVHVSLRENEEGYDFTVQSRVQLVDGRAGWQLHAQAKLLLQNLTDRVTLDVRAIDARCTRERTAEDPHGIVSKQERFVTFGQRWRVLMQASYGAAEALGRLRLPDEFVEELKEYRLHPSLLDIATGFAVQLIAGYDESNALWVPVSYERVRVRGPMPQRIVSWVRIKDSGRAAGEFGYFDVSVADEQGNVVVEVENFAMKRLPQEGDFALAPAPKEKELEMEAPRATVDRALSPGEVSFLYHLKQGITPGEGHAAFERILAMPPVAQIIVSSMDLTGLIEEANASASAPKEVETKFARPNLDTGYVAPRDELERTLVGFWEELLGVDQVGVQDSFFDLGGHSLIAVRLFAKIKKTLQVEFPISVLFEAPTIESCAALIRKALGDTDQAAHPTEDRHRTRFTHLVAMHPGSERATSDKVPFFLVAGMFGNVLNLRHLAHLIGTDRRFFGLQARGLYGDHTPHETFEAMAVDYLTELRTVQPKGPYILGGFSGGGLAAYEMARQLRAVGEEVALLVLLDTPLPQSPPLTGRDKVTMHLQQFRARGPAHLLQWAKARYTWETQKRRTRRQNGSATHRPFDFHSEAIEAAFRRALDRYELKPSPEKVALFRPKLDKAVILGPGRVINRDRRFIFEDNGWSPYVKSIEVFEVPGDHDSMVLEPNVRVLAARLRECIERAEREIGRTDRVRLVPDLPLKGSETDAGATPAQNAVEASAE